MFRRFILVTVFSLFVPSVVMAAAGDLDTTFGTGGIVQKAFPGGGYDSIGSVVILSNGEILVGGIAYNGTDRDSVIGLYHSDGSVDTAFGSAGFVVKDFVAGRNDGITGLAIDNTSRIIAVGSVDESGPGSDAFVVSFYNDGIQDMAFGAGGITVVSIPGTFEDVNGAFLTASQEIVTGGFSGGEFFAVKWDGIGILDTGFDSDGFVTSDLGAGNDFGRAAALQSDGKILVAGENQTAADVAVVRYHPDGSLDTTFDGDGIVRSNLTITDAGTAVIVQPDGKIVVGGRGDLGGNNRFLIVRYNADGSLDTTFDGDGFQTVDIGSGQDIVNGLALQQDGKIIAVGESDGPDGFGVVRLNTDGSLDTTFSGDGKFNQGVGVSGAQAISVAVASDGKIVVAGTDGADFALMRLQGDSSDLKIETDPTSSSIDVGADATLTMTVTNLGSVAVGGVRVTETLSSGLSLQSTSSPAGTCSVASASCSLGTLEAGGTAVVTAVVRGMTDGSADFSASVTGQVTDTDDTNDTATVSLTINTPSSGGSDGGTPVTGGDSSKTSSGCSLIR